MLKLIAIVGTNSKRSTNRQLLQYMSKHFSDKAEIELVEIKDIPMFNKPADRNVPGLVSEIAEKIENPNAIRAVGNALNANKLSIIIPCHRVLTKDMDFGGYNSGQNRKSWLLQHEGI